MPPVRASLDPVPSDTLPFVDIVLFWSRAEPGKSAVLTKEEDGGWDELARVEGTEYTVRGLHPERAHDFAATPVLADGGLAPEADWEKVRVDPLADEGAPALPGTPSLGRTSREAASLTITIEPIGDHATDAVDDQAGQGWPGTTTHLEDDGAGGLRLEALPAHFGAALAPFGSFAGVPAFARYWPEGTYETPEVSVGQVEHQRLEVHLGTAQPIDPAIPFGACRRSALGMRRRQDGTQVPLGTRGFASRNSWRATPLPPVDATVEVDTSPDPAGPWDGWRPYAPGTYTFRRVRVRVNVGGDGLRFVRVPRLVLVRRKLNRKQEGDVVVGPDNDAVVPFPVPFQNAPRVTAHILGFSGSVEIVSVSPTQVVLRPGAAVFAESPTTFAPTIHWQAMGT